MKNIHNMGFKKTKQQDKDAEKEFYNQPIKSISRINREVLYQVNHQNDLIKQVTGFASKIITNANLSRMRILEIGRDGEFTSELRDRYADVDISLTVGDIAITQLKDINSLSWKVNLDLEYMPFKENTYDIIFINGVLHHLPVLNICSRELMRVCKRCIIVANEPCGDNPLVLLSRFSSRILSNFFKINTTVNETMHNMKLYKNNFFQCGAKDIVIINGDKIYSNGQNWISYKSHMKKIRKSFPWLLLLIRSYLQRMLSLYFSKYLFSWNSYIIFITCQSSADTKNERKNDEIT